ncbi:MAG: CotH kinase family protein, partial [Planctomycetota bacterium]
MKRRGESSDAWPKKHYGMELWDENDTDTKAPILNMPSESDWILNNPYGDKTLMRNVLAYKWSNDIGQGFAAPGTKFVEVFVNDGGGNCSYDDYRGVYVLTEKIKVSDNRLDIGKLTPADNTEPEITGGYIVRIDKNYTGIYQEFNTTADMMTNWAGEGFQYFDPDQYTLNNTQKTWILNHFNEFETVLNSSTFDDPLNGYAKYIDAESFIESDIIAELFKEADNFVYSTYLYKEKNGKIAFGPEWDFNFSSGNATNDDWGYGTELAKATTSSGWHNYGRPAYGWHRRLLVDNDYELKTADKWFEHREDKLSDAQVAADIDYYYDLLDADGPSVDTGSTPADRNFAKWDILNSYEWCNYYYGGNSSQNGGILHTYKMEAEWLKNWFNGQGTPAAGESYSIYTNYSDRLGHLDALWLSDRNIAAPPTLKINDVTKNTGGTIAVGSTLTMSAATPGTIYYTTDGIDPRVFKGSGTINNIILVAETDAKKVLVPTSEVTGSGSTGSILREYWADITGTAVSDLTSDSNYPNVPTGSDLLTTFEAPINWADDYGTRIRGYLHPPTTKNYTFWVSGDDETQLWLSTDANPSNATQIAYVLDWTDSREWDKHGSQESNPIFLAAGQQYYIEVLHKEGQGGDNIAVAWDESGSLEIIDGAYLSQEGGQVWAGEGFDDSSWTAGSGGVGYEDSPSDPINFTALIDTDVQSAMSGVNPTCYIRIPFTVTGDPALFTSLSLNVRYDDGFIAYINGSEIKRVNADPGEPAWNSSASTFRSSDSLALDLESFDISGSIGTLKSGANMLAIQGLNSSAGSSDFLISASLTGSQDVAGTVYANAIEYTGPVTLNETTQIKARVRDTSGNWTALNEAIFSDSRVASSLRITEVMYNPVDPNDEFIEFTNIGPSTVNLAHSQLTKGVDFTFPDYDLAPNDHVLVVRNLSAFSLLHPSLVSSIAGEYTNDKLDNGGETIRLKDAAGVIIQEFEYDDNWFPITDGLDYSINIVDPTDATLDNWNKRLSWQASNVAGGTPGQAHAANAVTNDVVVINEVLTHTDDLVYGDWIELRNMTGSSINIGNWYLSDDKDDLKKYKIAAGTTIPANGYKVFTSVSNFRNTGDPGSVVQFGLSEHGENVYLSSGDGLDIAGGYSDSESFGSAANDTTFGRYTKSDGNVDFVQMTSQTRGTVNPTPAYVPDVVISEIMYNAQGIEDQLGEYIELYNRSGSTV